ncbi:hypothetical protein [Thalassospira sp.]|uniref:hypothetical protein n=1 Tax=Thalassospira sp. TaxID=1912094 RepID=UPI0027353885|nr:hypothetical protein [Thalassospira sp.]MDP2699909.1 hypothetical protein [Thalassospira sp.]
MLLNIEPYKSIGPILLSMTKENVRDVIKCNFEHQEKSKISGIEIDAKDYFSDFGIMVHYNKCGNVCFVEVDNLSNVVFKDVTLFDQSFDIIKKWFMELDDKIMMQDAGFTSLKFGISFFSPDHLEYPTRPPELISIFEKNYYEN